MHSNLFESKFPLGESRCIALVILRINELILLHLNLFRLLGVPFKKKTIGRALSSLKNTTALNNKVNRESWQFGAKLCKYHLQITPTANSDVTRENSYWRKFVHYTNSTWKLLPLCQCGRWLLNFIRMARGETASLALSAHLAWLFHPASQQNAAVWYNTPNYTRRGGGEGGGGEQRLKSIKMKNIQNSESRPIICCSDQIAALSQRREYTAK